MEDPERKLFLDKLNQYNQERDVSLSTNPTVSKQPLDLYRLYLAVKARGGFQDVTKHKLWKEVALSCNLLMNPSMAYTIRKQYIKHLLPYECHFDRGGIDPVVLQSLLENSNRKKSRSSIPSPGSDGRDSNSQSSYPQSGTPGSMDNYGVGNYLQPAYPSPSGIINSPYSPEYNHHLMPPIGPHPGGHGKKMRNIPSPGSIDSNSQGSFPQSNDVNYPPQHVGINNYGGQMYPSIQPDYSHHTYGMPGQQPSRQYSPHPTRKKSKGVPSPGSTDSNSQGSYPRSGTPVEATPYSGHGSNYSEVYPHGPIINSDYQTSYSHGHALGSRISPHSRKMKGVPSPGSLDGNSQGSYPTSNTPVVMEQYTSHSGQASNNFSGGGNSHYSNYPERSTPTGSSSHPDTPTPPVSNSGSSGGEILSAQDPFSDEMQPNGLSHRKHLSGQLNNCNQLPSPYANCESNYSPNSPSSNSYFAPVAVQSKSSSATEFNNENNNLGDGTSASNGNDSSKNADGFNCNQDTQFQRPINVTNSQSQQGITTQSESQKNLNSSNIQASSGTTGISAEHEFCVPPNYECNRNNRTYEPTSSRPEGYAQSNNSVTHSQRMPVHNTAQAGPLNKIGHLQRPVGPYQQGYTNEYVNEMPNYQNQIRTQSRLAQQLLAAKINQHAQSQGTNYGSGYTDNSPYRVPPTGLSSSSTVGYEGASNLNLPPCGSYMKRHADFAKGGEQSRSYSTGPSNIPSHYDSRYAPVRSNVPPNFGPNGPNSVWPRDSQYRYGPPSSSQGGPQSMSLSFSRDIGLDQPSGPRNEANWQANRYGQGGPNVNSGYSAAMNSQASADFYNNVGQKVMNTPRRNLDARGIYGSGSNPPESGSNLTRLLTSSPSLPSPGAGNMADPGNQHGRVKRESGFPINSVESTMPVLTKKKKLNAKDLPQVDAWRLLMCLKSGLLAESTWALDILIVLANDDNTILYFGLSHLPGLLETLLEHYKRYLEEIFPTLFSNKTKSAEHKVKEETVLNSDNLCENGEKTVLLRGKNYTLKSRNGKDVKLKSSSSLFLKNKEFNWEGKEDAEMDHIITTFVSKGFSHRFSKVYPVATNSNEVNGEFNKINKTQDMDKTNENDDQDIFSSLSSSSKRVKALDLDEMEEEALSSDDEPLSVVHDYCDSLSKRCVCLSTLIRNISFVPGNDVQMRKNRLLLEILSKLLLFNHIHVKKRQNSDKLFNEDDSKDSLENNKSDLLKDAFKISENDNIFEDKWWSETLHILRENSLVTLANIAGQLDLGPFDDKISYPIIDGLLHWSICPSSYAVDPLPSTSLEYLSAKRLSLEILVKLSILEGNVDLILATRPWSRMQKLLGYLIKLLNRNEEQTLREFGLVLLNNFISADSAIARAVVIYGIVPALIGFIEQSEASALTVANTQGINALRENPELMGTTLDMVRRAAECLRCLSWISENKPIIASYQQRLLNLVMSQILDQGVASIVSYVIYQCASDEKLEDNISAKKEEKIDETNKNIRELKNEELKEINGKDGDAKFPKDSKLI